MHTCTWMNMCVWVHMWYMKARCHYQGPPQSFFIFNYNLFIFSCMYVEQGRHGCRGTCMQIRGQSAGAGSILLLHEYQGTNSGHPSLEASTLPDEPSGWLPLTFGDRVFPQSRLTQQGQLAMKVFMWGLDFLMRVSPHPQG